MAVDDGAAPTLSVPKTDGLLLSQSTISVARLSELSSVRPLCHTDQAPPRPASRLKGFYYETLLSRLTGAEPVRGMHGKEPFVHP